MLRGFVNTVSNKWIHGALIYPVQTNLLLSTLFPTCWPSSPYVRAKEFIYSLATIQVHCLAFSNIIDSSFILLPFHLCSYKIKTKYRNRKDQQTENCRHKSMGLLFICLETDQKWEAGIDQISLGIALFPLGVTKLGTIPHIMYDLSICRQIYTKEHYLKTRGKSYVS